MLKWSYLRADPRLESTRKDICTLQSEIEFLDNLTGGADAELKSALEEDIVGRVRVTAERRIH